MRLKISVIAIGLASTSTPKVPGALTSEVVTARKDIKGKMAKFLQSGRTIPSSLTKPFTIHSGIEFISFLINYLADYEKAKMIAQRNRLRQLYIARP